MTDSRRYWIFQGNPQQYDIAGAVRALEHLDWSARQGGDRMQVGDRVFLWETGQNGRLVATGVITEGLHDRSRTSDAERPFVRQYQADQAQALVGVGQLRSLPDPVTRDQVKQHPLLRRSSTIANHRGTNLELRAAEGLALEALIAGATNPRIVKVSPGARASLWERCRKEGMIAVGWEEIENLKIFVDQEAFAAAFERTYPSENAGHVTIKSRELWTMRELASGDIVVANKGVSQVLAVGIVQPPGYEHRPEVGGFPHTVSVAWDTSYATPHHRPYWAFRTVADIDLDELDQILSGGYEPPEKQPSVPSVVKRDESSSTADIGGYLVARGLYFPHELVSAYLLALQTRRLVLLTGISGTGKTALAHAVAEWFAPEVDEAVPDETAGAAELITTQHYMIKYRRFVLPAGLHAGLELPDRDADGRRRLAVSWPGGAAALTLTVEPDRKVVWVLLKGEVREWFLGHLKVGDPFELVVNADDGALESLELRLPAAAPTKTRLNNSVTVAVRPDWTDNRGLLGYYNPLTRQYVPTPFLRLLIRAEQELHRAQDEGRAPRAFFAIMDEMNLARVEHYFSDFLSCMESGQPIHLHDDPRLEQGEADLAEAIPRCLSIPANLYITGTVNVDETTYMFSPKVLDRAFTLELNHVSLDAFGRGAVPEADGFFLSRAPRWLSTARKPGVTDWHRLRELSGGELTTHVTGIHDLLAKRDRHFGYRVAAEIARYVTLAADQSDGAPGVIWQALDFAVKAKVLAKLHGTRQEVEGLLTDLLDVDSADLLPRTADKVRRMLGRAQAQGFTSFMD